MESLLPGLVPFSYEQGEHESGTGLPRSGNVANYTLSNTDGQISHLFFSGSLDPATQPQAVPVRGPNGTITNCDNNDNNENVHLMAPPPPPNPRKRKAPTLRLDDWAPVKDRVIELHISKNLPLPKVQEMIQEEFDFTAT